MFKVQFINQNNHNLFREKSFTSPKQMHEFIKQFQLLEGKEFSFFDKELKNFYASFESLAAFSENKDKGFRLYFHIK
ncbi:MAG: hypothetical protein Q8906_07525 [Bacillota bacterium]|nr:hypothetical protein [Bacillota bacterium]